jgi:hypothetical protein
MSKINRMHHRREFLIEGGVAVAGLGCAALGLKNQPAFASLPPEDRPNTHNMMIVGDKTVYLSHLPMFVTDGTPPTFNSPHRFQVILEAAFTDGNRDLTAAYTSDRASHPTEKMYTLNPAQFVLSRINPSGVALKKFRGNTIFRGHLERNGQPFIGFEGDRPPVGGVFDVNVKRVVHFHQFSKQATKPAQLEYLLFGKSPELFLAHFITKPNDFDQIISVKITGQSFTDEQLGKGMHVVFAGRGNVATERMKESETADGKFQLAGESPRTISVEVLREFYFEEGELAVPPDFEPTEEEKKAGFG